MWIPQDLIKEMQAHLHELAEVEEEMSRSLRSSGSLVHRRNTRGWLPTCTIRLSHRPGGRLSLAEIAEQGRLSSHSAPASLHLHYEPGTINELAKMSTPVAITDAEHSAVQQISMHGLQPLGMPTLGERRSSATPRHSLEERPSSRGSSGVMIEERNLSDSKAEESDVGDGAAAASGGSRRSVEQRRQSFG